MRSKILSMIALIVSACALFISIAFLVYRIQNEMSYSALFYQIIATGLISILCFFNVIYLFTSDENDNSDNDND